MKIDTDNLHLIKNDPFSVQKIDFFILFGADFWSLLRATAGLMPKYALNMKGTGVIIRN